jgi:hypothetical protein
MKLSEVQTITKIDASRWLQLLLIAETTRGIDGGVRGSDIEELGISGKLWNARPILLGYMVGKGGSIFELGRQRRLMKRVQSRS